MKQVKLLSSTLLHPTQKLLLGFARRNVLDCESSDYESEDDDIKLVKKMKT